MEENVAVPGETAPPTAAGASRIAAAILALLREIPRPGVAESPAPAEAARRVARTAATRAATAAGTLALPVGPLGWLTILPEMAAVWRIQARMVADIAALYGKEAQLNREQMLYCLFRHSAAQAVRDLVVRVGERTLVRRTSLRALQFVAGRIGVRVSQRVIGKGLARWLPVAGAVGVGAYAYYDTTQVAATAMRLFELPVDIEAGQPQTEPGVSGSPLSERIPTARREP